MSRCFGYEDDCKILAKNKIAIQIDAHERWKWCSSKLISLILKKCVVWCLKGVAKVSIHLKVINLKKTSFEKIWASWSQTIYSGQHRQRRCEKTMNALLTIKRNVANGTPWTNRKNLYRHYNYIVPILSYDAVLRKSSKTDLESSESIQTKASKWILGTSQLEYRELLRRILLTFALYHEMHVLFIQIVLNTYDHKWQKFATRRREKKNERDGSF